MRPNWNDYFMVIAKIVSTRSTCNSRPTGAVIVRDKQILSTGYNGSMPGAPHCADGVSDDGRPFCYRRSVDAPESDKYNYCRSSHAEANAISRAARLGIKLDGATCFVTLAPCYVCLKLLAGAGVRHIFYEHVYESTDKRRDLHWRTVIDESPIETFEQLKVSERMIRKVAASLIYPTSRRRLSEDYRVMFDPYAGNEIDDVVTEAEFRGALVDCLAGGVEDGRFQGPAMRLEVERKSVADAGEAEMKKALSFLAEKCAVEKTARDLSFLTEELAAELSVEERVERSLGEDFAVIRASIRKGSLAVEFRFSRWDIWNDLRVAAAIAKVLAKGLFEAISESGAALESASVGIAIDAPFFPEEDWRLVKSYIVNC